MSLLGVSVLGHVIARCQAASVLDDIVVASPDRDIIDRAIDAGADGFWAISEENLHQDVLRRVYLAACAAGASIVVRVCADNPLLWPEGIDNVVRALRDEPRHKRVWDYAGYRLEGGLAAISWTKGYFCEAVTLEALAKAERVCRRQIEREHVTIGMYAADGHHYDKFVRRWLDVPEWYGRPWPIVAGALIPAHAMRSPPAAIDTPEDLERVAAMIAERQIPWAENGVLV